jgi:hypothetical protein
VGSGDIRYAVDASTNLADRTGYITVFAQDAIPPHSLVLTINQRAATCTYTLSTDERTHGFGGATNGVSVNTLLTCSWLVINTNDWVTILSAMPAGGFSGSNSIHYLVTNNPYATARTGVVMIADQNFIIVQRSSEDGPPFAFQTIEATGVGQSGQVRLRLAGAPAGVWEVQTSTNLSTWAPLAVVTNLTGAVEYLYSPPAGNRRFYRALRLRPLDP